MIYRLVIVALILTSCSGTKIYDKGKTNSQLMKEDGLIRCEGFCYTEGQKFSEILTFGPGGCICDNEYGRKIKRSLGKYLKDS